MKTTALAAVLLGTAAAAFAQPAAENELSAAEPAPPRFNGIPVYQIYEDKDLENASRGNFIEASPNNTVYFSNDNGIHTFDGSRWKQIIETEATREKIRSLLWIDGEIFASSYSSVGRLEISAQDGARYRQINQHPLSNEASEFYPRIHGASDAIYFIGMRSVVILERASERLTSIPFGTWVKESYLLNGVLHVTTDRDGLWKLVDGVFQKVPAFASFIEERNICVLDVSPNGQIAFATESGELYRIVNERPVRAFPRFGAGIEGAVIDMVFVDDERVAIAIAGAGVYIVDPEGNVLSAVDRRFDYRWSAARSLRMDRHGALWVLFNSSVAKVLVDSPVTFIDERLRPSLDFAMAHVYDGALYLRNYSKLYRSVHGPDGQLVGFANALPDSSLSISLALTAPDGLYIHAEDTTYLFRDGALLPLAAPGRMDRLVAFRSDPNLLLGLSPRRIKVLRREGMSLEIVAETEHSAGLVNKIARDRDDVFWLEIGIGKLGKVWFEDGQPKFKLYTQSDGLPPDWVAIWEHEGDVNFTERTGVFKYHPESDRFVRSDDWEPYFPRAAGSFHRAATDPSGNVWASFNHSNYILWKQPDGTYIKDAQSLAQLGDLYMNQFEFLENGDTILLSATEMYHFDRDRSGAATARQLPASYIAEVSNLEGSFRHYLNDGFARVPPTLRLGASEESIAVRVSNPFSSTIKPPSYQYFLEGLSKDWSKWSSSNEFIFTNLDHGAYRLRVRTHLGGGAEPSETGLAFAIQPSPLETPAAYISYALTALALLIGGHRFFSRNLKSANEKLERMVAERTREVERKNCELERQAEALESKNLALANQSEQLQANAQSLTTALIDLHNAQDQLMNTSRKAGMAEVATNVLHNVGNVLNSINVGVLGLADSLEQHRIEKLVRLAELVDAHADDLPDFLTQSAKGRAVPEYLKKLALVLQEDFAKYALEVDSMRDNIEHVKKIIATQQAHAKTVDVYQEIDLPELIDSAIMMIMGDVEHAIFEITREYDPNLRIISDKHRILQMVANFVKNGKEAIKEANPPLGMINISGRFDAARANIVIAIRDNGIGIDPENLRKIFTHGFTTKTDGHGFGMHSCANSAKVLGGSLKIHSDGPQRGATVTLTLPVAPPRHDEVELEKQPQFALRRRPAAMEPRAAESLN